MSIQSPLFGISGCPSTFDRSRFRSDKAQAPLWVQSIGLDLYEIPWTFNLPTSEMVKRLTESIAASGISVSVHASYYIVLGSAEQKKMDGSMRMLAKTC